MRTLALLTFMLMPGAPARADTFEQVLHLVAEKHPRLVASRQLTRAGRADVRAARSSYRPQLGVQTDLGWAGRTASSDSGIALAPEVSVSQLVFDGGRTAAEIQRRRVRVDLLGVQEQAVLAQLSVQLAKAWIDHARAEQLVAISEQQVAALGMLATLVKDIASFDRGRASDVVMVDSRLQQAETTLETRRIALVEARARVREIAALPVEPEGSVADLSGALPPSAEACRGIAASSPAVQIADLEAAESEQAVRGTRNWWMPQLAVEGARTSERTADGRTNLLNGFAVRLRASALPFDSGGGRARHESAKAAFDAARSNAELIRTSLADQAARLWTFQAQRRERLSALEGIVGKSDEARDIVFEQFRIGRRSILDVLAYDLERFNSRAQLVNERHDIATTQYELLGILGRVYPALWPEAVAL